MSHKGQLKCEKKKKETAIYEQKQITSLLHHTIVSAQHFHLLKLTPSLRFLQCEKFFPLKKIKKMKTHMIE